jgi:hypothetical protein
VRGSVAITRAGSRLRIEVLAKQSALGRRGRKNIRVGSSNKSAAAGTARFTINLNSAAKRALRSRGRLPLTVRIIVTPAVGAPYTKTSSVTVRR